MKTIEIDRRRLLKGVGSAVVAAGVPASFALAGRPGHAAGPAAMTQTKESQAATTPRQALQILKDGNARFVAGKMLRRDLIKQVKATAKGQFPIAAIVGCIDSRASNQLIFDQGIGDIFSARVAGNFVNDDMLGSLEFACAAAGAKLIVVVGHTECGAVMGACDDIVMGNLAQTLANIKPAVAAVPGFKSDRTSGNSAFVQAVTKKNVELTLQRIQRRSPILEGMADRGAIALAGAMYDVHTGRVTFM